jgi:type IV pilus assembly protein PilB
MRSALTGHLVLSTLHTNDAPSTIARLIDIGIPSYLVTASLRLIVAQRLVRKLCTNCKEPVEVKDGDIPEGIVINTPIIYKAKGCDKCNFIGYKRRTLISEILLIDDDIRDAIHKGSSNKDIMAAARRKGALSLLESGIKKVEEGITSLEEVMSVVVI